MATCPPEAAEHDRLSVPHIRTFRFRFTRIISRYGMTVEIASDTLLWKRLAAEDALSDRVDMFDRQPALSLLDRRHISPAEHRELNEIVLWIREVLAEAQS